MNSTTACTFPEPFYNISELQARPVYHDPVEALIHKQQVIEKNPYTIPISKELIEQFLGRYGNFAYGNVTVVADDVTEELMMVFESFSCTIRNATHVTLCFGNDEYWNSVKKPFPVKVKTRKNVNVYNLLLNYLITNL